MPTPAEKALRYGIDHQRLRNHWAKRINRGEVVPCWRCGGPIDKHTPFDLGHDRTTGQTMGPEHRHRTGPCPGNRAEGATYGNRQRAQPAHTRRAW